MVVEVVVAVLLVVQVGWCLILALHDCVHEVGASRLVGVGLAVICVVEAVAAVIAAREAGWW